MLRDKNVTLGRNGCFSSTNVFLSTDFSILLRELVILFENSGIIIHLGLMLIIYFIGNLLVQEGQANLKALGGYILSC
jgi:hypothetical protein